MADVTALTQYRTYLEAVDDEAKATPEEEYIDLLSPGEVADLLVIRDELTDAGLSPEERRELERLDDLIAKHWRLIAENIPPHPERPRSHWWWHLHEGPQVRGERRAAARATEAL